MMMWDIVMMPAPLSSKKRRPSVSIVQTLVATPTNWVTFRMPDMISCIS